MNFGLTGLGGLDAARAGHGSLVWLLGAVRLRSGNYQDRRICRRLPARDFILCSRFPLLVLRKLNPRFLQIEGKRPMCWTLQLGRQTVAHLRPFPEFLAPWHRSSPTPQTHPRGERGRRNIVPCARCNERFSFRLISPVTRDR